MPITRFIISGIKRKMLFVKHHDSLVVYVLLDEAPYLLPIPEVSASVLSPIPSIILFLSVVQVSLAAETLPENSLRERKFRDHIKKVSNITSE